MPLCVQGNPGFETILALPHGAISMATEESSCIGCDCYDSCENCDGECEVCDSQ